MSIPINHKDNLEKLKGSIQDMVLTDDDFQGKMLERMQTTLFGKFLGKAQSLEQAKRAFLNLWKNIGSYKVADMAIGFYLIKCKSLEMVDRLL